MPDQNFYLELVQRISRLESRLAEQAVKKHLFEITNITRVVLGADQTSWDIPDVDVISVEASVAAINIHGIANGVNGRVLYVHNNKSGTTVTLKSNSGSAASGEKIYGGAGVDVALGVADAAMLVYLYNLGTSSYFWRIFFVSP